MNPLCPDNSQLEKLLRGQLDDEEHSSLVAHIDSCKKCQNRVTSRASSTLGISNLSGSTAEAFSSEVENDKLIARLKRLTPGSDFPALSSELTTEVLPDLQRFKPNTIIGQGGMGVVYSARDEQLNRQVAVKLMSRADTKGKYRRRFFNEAEVTGELEHPGIIPVYQLHDDSETPWYAMKLVHGSSLQAAIDAHHQQSNQRFSQGSVSNHDVDDRQPLSRRELLTRFIDVCNAVAFAHSRGILHRDLKPANIMLGEFGETLVIDWGLAKRLISGSSLEADSETDDENMETTRYGQVVGTLEFMSPEQAQGQLNKLRPQSDIFSLGATLFYLLTGQSPTHGIEKNKLLDHVQQGEFATPLSVSSAVPKPLDAVCRRAMTKNPDERYPDAKQLATEIESYLADLPVLALPDSLATKVRRWMRKNPLPVATAALALLVVLISAATLTTVVSTKNREL
ncbi:MAG: serine/threonine-protein kinase, partial [Planctomycetota bacterium]